MAQIGVDTRVWTSPLTTAELARLKFADSQDALARDGLRFLRALMAEPAHARV